MPASACSRGPARMVWAMNASVAACWNTGIGQRRSDQPLAVRAVAAGALLRRTEPRRGRRRPAAARRAVAMAGAEVRRYATNAATSASLRPPALGPQPGMRVPGRPSRMFSSRHSSSSVRTNAAFRIPGTKRWNFLSQRLCRPGIVAGGAVAAVERGASGAAADAGARTARRSCRAPGTRRADRAGAATACRPSSASTCGRESAGAGIRLPGTMPAGSRKCSANQFQLVCDPFRFARTN